MFNIGLAIVLAVIVTHLTGIAGQPKGANLVFLTILWLAAIFGCVLIALGG